MALAAACGARAARRGGGIGAPESGVDARMQAPNAQSCAGRAVKVRLLAAPRAGPRDVLAADALIFATPEYLGSMSGMVKDFFDRSYYGVLDRVAGRAYASIVCAGSDGQGAARQIARIATGWRMREVCPPLVVCTHAQTPAQILAPKTLPQEDLERARELGAAMAGALSMGIW